MTEPTNGSDQPSDGPDRDRRRGRRLVASMATTALVVGATGAGIGFALGKRQQGSAAAGGAMANASTRSRPAYGWTAPPDPWDGGGTGGGAGVGVPSMSTADATTATAGQVTGLVRIVATLTGGKAVGTGLVLSSGGEVVTNHHVVVGATTIRATVMATGKTYRARVVGTDAADDIAVLRLRGAAGLSTVTTNRDAVTVGDRVTAIGDARGTVRHLSAAAGTVTALRRSITTNSEDGTSEHLTRLLEIDADVVAGDSGGATVDGQGEVVGMTTAASTGAGAGSVSGYAIPIAKVVRIADRIESGHGGGKIQLGYDAFLGVELDPRTRAATVAGVLDGSPAARAGLASGATITGVGGTRVSTAGQLRAAVRAHAVGAAVMLTWTDLSGASHSTTVTLARGPVA